MSSSIVKIRHQEVSDATIEKIAKFLAGQPKWHYPKEDEIDPKASGWRTKEGIEQHWLWRAENQAHSWNDFNHWPETQTDRAHLIMPGELFLCDLVGGELWIGRMPHEGKKAEKIARVCDNMNAVYGNCFNGYAILPLKGIGEL
jgi:hypothetical protein